MQNILAFTISIKDGELKK